MNLKASEFPDDKRFLDAALRLARKHQGLTGTNPSVACVIVKDLGHGPVVVGSGVTAMGGRPHAEPPALEEAGTNANGATAYVTLEPCAHHGKTPPCAQNLIDAGVNRVVTAITDPDERVNGNGHQMMEDAGISIIKADGGENARRVLAGYLSSRSRKRPYVTLKLAMTEDGIIGSRNNGNLRISGPVSNRQTHLSRARHDAILVGTGTALDDDPWLTCRLPGLENRSPLRVILDVNSRLNDSMQIVQSARTQPTMVVGSAEAPAAWVDMLRTNGIQLLTCELSDGKVALPELLDDLHARGIQSLMVEGGASVAGSFLEDGQVDEIIVHLGGDPERPNDPGNAVMAPFTINKLPHGFRICQKLIFGADTAYRLLRKDS